MRLGESCARRGEEARRFLDGPGVVGVVGVAGADGQSSDRLSSHGSLPIFSSFGIGFCYDAAPKARVTLGGSRSVESLRGEKCRDLGVTDFQLVQHGDIDCTRWSSGSRDSNGG